MDEVWRPVIGYEGSYEVSDHGRVRSIDRVIETRKGPRRYRGRILKPGRGEYLHVVLPVGHSKQQCFRVHILMLETFVGPRPDGLIGCHNDGDHFHNHISNLRWDTYSSNSHDKVRHGKDPKANKTECIHGHVFTPENTINDRWGRHCRACSRINAARQRARQKRRAIA